MRDTNLHLLLSHADDGAPVLKDGLPEAATVMQGSALGVPEYGRVEIPSGDPNELDNQGWCVLAPEGAGGDRLLELIGPLIKAREEQQGDVRIYRVPSALSPAEANRWSKTHFETGEDFLGDLPKYQLLLGDLHELPLSIQQAQGNQGYVGRLCFRKERDYESYVDKVLRFEKARDRAEARAKFFTVHDGSRATVNGYQGLIQPGMDLLRKRDYEVEEVGNLEAPSPDEFLETAKSPDPTVLFSVSHGAGTPRAGWASYDEQRERQGAMSFGRKGTITGADIGEAPFLPGGIWFMLASHGAGTPTREASAYRHWLEKLTSVDSFGGAAQAVLAALPTDNQAPFIAKLPQAVLAKPNGPLAILGHVDLAWTYSFDGNAQSIERPGKFMEILRSVLRGFRVGVAFRQFLDFIAQMNKEIGEIYDEQERKGADPAPDLARLGHLWMLRQNLASYILLGDPAVQLSPSSAGKKRRPTASNPGNSRLAHSIQGAPPEETRAAAQTPPSLPIDLDKLEEAIGSLLTEDITLKKAAEQYKIDRKELEALSEQYKNAGRAAIGAKVELEEAIAHLLAEDMTLKQAAEQYKVDRKELEALSEKYKNAGRAAIGAK